MVRKRITVFLMVIISFMLPLVAFFIERRRYLYPVSCDFNLTKWLFVCGIVLVFEFIVYLIIKCLKKKTKLTILLSIILSLTLIPQIIFDSFFIGMFSGTNWQSYTNDVDNFGKLDPYFDSQFEFCDLKMSEIMSKKTTSVNEYSYKYQTSIGAVDFDVFFQIKLPDEEYSYLKTIFQTKMNTENETNISQTDLKIGRFIVSENTPTSVDKWDEMYIDYNDSTHTFFMKFKGVCYT